MGIQFMFSRSVMSDFVSCDCGRPGFPVQLLGSGCGNEDEWQRLSIMHCDHLHFGEIGLENVFSDPNNIQSSLALDGNGLFPSDSTGKSAHSSTLQPEGQP